MNDSVKKTTKRTDPLAQDATTFLTKDHKNVNGLFSEYEKSRSNAKKKQIVAQLCTELLVHTQLEEEIFYPAVKLALKDREVIPEALVEHDVLKALIMQVENIEPDGEMFDARIKVLSEYVKHHVREEHTIIFPKARSNWIDLMELGARMVKRKAELMAERGKDITSVNHLNRHDLFAELPNVGLGGRPSPDELRIIDRRVSRANGKDHI